MPRPRDAVAGAAQTSSGSLQPTEAEVAALQRDSRRGSSSKPKDSAKSAPSTEQKEPPPASTDQKSAPAAGADKAAPASVDEAKGAPAEPASDVWPDGEVITALQDCLRMLGPITAEVEIAPMTKSGACGTPAPVYLRRVGSDKVDVRPPALLNCRMVVALNQWVDKTLQPTARELFGSSVTRLHGTSGYACRNRYNNPNDKISEHAFANAIDITGFVLANGRAIDVVSQWGLTERDIKAQKLAALKAMAKLSDAKAVETKDLDEGHHGNAEREGSDKDKASSKVPPSRLGAIATSAKEDDAGPNVEKAAERRPQKPRVKSASQEKYSPAPPASPSAPADGAPTDPKLTAEATFLRRLHAGACKVFGTVLGPEANDAHRNHFHLDMASRRRSSYCQ